LHESVVQALLSLQFDGVPAVQTPLWQLSPVVQALPSLQAVPSALFGLLHAPVDILQTPATWH
jgi:hypothetical protein